MYAHVYRVFCFINFALFFFQSDPSEKYHHPRTIDIPWKSNKVGWIACQSQGDHIPWGATDHLSSRVQRGASYKSWASIRWFLKKVLRISPALGWMLSESTSNSVVGCQFSQHQQKHNESKAVIGKQAAVTHLDRRGRDSAICLHCAGFYPCISIVIRGDWCYLGKAEHHALAVGVRPATSRQLS